eukprot:546752_1
MTKSEFEQFAARLPEQYQKRFVRLGTFAKLSNNKGVIEYADFEMILDVFAEMVVDNVDIDFELVKTSNPNALDINRAYNISKQNSFSDYGSDYGSDADDEKTGFLRSLSVWKKGRKARSRTNSPARSIVGDNEFEIDAISNAGSVQLSNRSISGRRFEYFDIFKDNENDSMGEEPALNPLQPTIDNNDQTSIDMDKNKLLETTHVRSDFDNSELRKTLMTQKIIFDSLMKVYSSKSESYITVAGILTMKYLYFTSPVTYHIWQELQDRTKIRQLSDENTEIDQKLADELTSNLGLITDADQNQSYETIIKSYFSGKTTKEIKMSILLNTHYHSLTEIFPYITNLVDSNNLKTIKYVIINNYFNIFSILKKQANDLIDYLFENIHWVNNYQRESSNVFELKQYHPASIITLLNNRNQKWWLENASESNINIEENLVNFSVEEYGLHKMEEQETIIYRTELDKGMQVNTLNLSDVGYGLELKQKNVNVITLQFQSNNKCHEWITFLDCTINNQDVLNAENNLLEVHSNINKKNSIKYKLINDFTLDNHAQKEKYNTKFSFGEYLNYWQTEYENSVTPKYTTLKQEL